MGLPHFSDTIPAAPTGARNVRWQRLPDTDLLSAHIPIFVGDSNAGGAAGLVPPSTADDVTEGRVLKADGTWYRSNPMTAAGDLIIGGASGAPTRLAAGADGYILTSAGPGSAPSWQANSGGGGGSSSSVDTPPSSPTAWDDEFDGSALASKWSWIARTSNTSAAIVNGELVLTATAGGDVYSYPQSILAQAAPSGSWQFTAKMRSIAVGGYNTDFGLVAYESSSGKYIHAHLGATSGGTVGFGAQKWNSLTSWNSNVAVYNGILDGLWSYVYIRLQYDGSSLVCSISRDGLAWLDMGTVAFPGFMSTISHVGLDMYNGGTPTITGKGAWFRRTA
jgi:hypothetical protein